MMGDSDDANHIVLQPVNQGIGETMERESSCVVCAGLAQFGELVEVVQCLIEFIGEVACCYKRPYADVPVNSGIGIGLRLFAKFDLHRFWPC